MEKAYQDGYRAAQGEAYAEIQQSRGLAIVMSGMEETYNRVWQQYRNFARNRRPCAAWKDPAARAGDLLVWMQKHLSTCVFPLVWIARRATGAFNHLCFICGLIGPNFPNPTRVSTLTQRGCTWELGKAALLWEPGSGIGCCCQSYSYNVGPHPLGWISRVMNALIHTP